MKISVIAIFYNSAPYLKKCVDSVLRQQIGGGNLELIAVDDCSTDETLSMLRAVRDSRLKVVVHDKNKGIAAARNTGLKHMTGDCFFFIDGDDFLPENALATLMSHYNEQVDWVSGAYGMCSPDGKVQRVNGRRYCDSPTKEQIEADFAQHEFIYVHNKLVNARLRDICFPIGKAHEDRFWNVEAYARIQHVVNIEEPTYHYVMRPSSFSSRSRATRLYIDSAVELLERMQGLPSCWDVVKNTFMITAIEKNLFIWKQENSYRKEVLARIKPMVDACKMDVGGFPRFTKFVHRMLKADVPDEVIEMVACGYRNAMRLLRHPV